MNNDFKDAFHSFSQTVKPDSKPGVPLMLMGATKAFMLENHYQLVRFLVWRRLKLLANTDAEYLKYFSSEDLVEFGYADPFKVFPKNEATPERKLTPGSERNRLIQNESLTQEMVERFLLYNLTKREIYFYGTEDLLRPAPVNGVGFDDRGAKAVAFRANAMADRASSDVEAYDWSVRVWAYELDLEAKRRCLVQANDMRLKNVFDNHAYTMMHKVFVFSDGSSLVQIDEGGIQVTGSFNTGSGNSNSRWINQLAMRQKLGLTLRSEMFSNGDDAVEEYVEGAVEAYRSLGLHVREYARATTIDFCSHIWDASGTNLPKPTGVVKMLVQYLFSAVGPHEGEIVDALCRELTAFGPEDEEYPMIVAVLGPRFEGLKNG